MTQQDPYSTRYVAFIDILGFSEIVAKTSSPQQIEQRRNLVASLGTIGNRELDSEFGDDFKFQQFSDSIVMSDKANEIGLFNLLDAVANLAIALLESGVLIRGGAAKGPLHHDNQLIFGPAFLEAYRLEVNISKYPRVVLSQSILEDAAEYIKAPETGEKIKDIMSIDEAKELIKLGDDGPAFIHIFRESPFRNDMLISSTIFNLLKASMHDPRHYEKLRWLAIYWNACASNNDATKVTLERSDWTKIIGN